MFDIVGRDPDALRAALAHARAASGDSTSPARRMWARVGASGFVSGHSTHADRIATIRDVHRALRRGHRSAHGRRRQGRPRAPRSPACRSSASRPRCRRSSPRRFARRSAASRRGRPRSRIWRRDRSIARCWRPMRIASRRSSPRTSTPAADRPEHARRHPRVGPQSRGRPAARPVHAGRARRIPHLDCAVAALRRAVGCDRHRRRLGARGARGAVLAARTARRDLRARTARTCQRDPRA